ncbi:MAG: succinate dehydrogenase iron-sulfur subunit [Thermanaeromonas sp.]|uniref:succinate dehydrogenase/fumarate reductase iron-sulfur subunit n=1 Tax=Thermanaeromonas sp. TaxID=2003697 RepID=UPI00243E6894|nr:succinate dehydrogenase iron-sulfur subunit [Thermanaeromonas sp.]MCG0277800.1 succinate dehydrogenase iron-sulfur subunit [Thermanaeromonas sp.]
MATFRIQRYNPEKDTRPYLQTYEVPVERGMSILDCLFYIKENLDATLSFRASCRMGICGSCAMYINGLPRLACETQVESLRTDTIEIRPLPNYEIIKDLVVDLSPLFDKHQKVKPWIISSDAVEVDRPTKEYSQSPAQLEGYLQFAYCLKCGICLAACPTVATDKEFLGPQALAQAFRYSSDNRDNGFKERISVVDTLHGLWRCHMAGACAEVCPKGVDPALAIQLMKRKAIFGHKEEQARLLEALLEATPIPGIPKAPEPTVKKK